MARKYKANILSQSSIKDLIKDLKEYRNSLDSKMKEFMDKLVDIAVKEIEANIALAGITVGSDGVESGSDITHTTEVTQVDGESYAKATITVSGKEILFIEFGAGVYYNDPPSSHPKGEEFGFTIGSYGKGFGLRQVWGYFDDNGELRLTHGVKATMPMYKAIQRVNLEAPKIAKQVFGG